MLGSLPKEYLSIIAGDPGIDKFLICVNMAGDIFYFGYTESRQLRVLLDQKSTYQSDLDNHLSTLLTTEEEKVEEANKKFADKATSLIGNKQRTSLKDELRAVDKAKRKLQLKKALLRKTDEGAKRLVKKMQKMQFEIEKVRDNLHQYTANFLSLYNLVLLPEFHNSNDIVKKKLWELNKPAKEVLMCLAHGQFRVTLRHKCRLLGTQVTFVSEAYSTKT